MNESGRYGHSFLCFSRESLKKKLCAVFDEADILITSGGVSMGEMVCF